MKKYNTKLHIDVQTDEDDLLIKTGIECIYPLPPEIREQLSDLLVKLPILIRTGWFIITNKYPDAENGFSVVLNFDFEQDEDNDWFVSSHIDDTKKVDCMILGMSKMIIQEDPIIDEIIDKELESLDLTEHIQHFDPTC